ncbi:MAG: outer membrane beta-barrel protein [Lentisphaeria bacterium]|nr:outer membrane beta-barrel protein [Lentisphaeria bacterium]
MSFKSLALAFAVVSTTVFAAETAKPVATEQPVQEDNGRFEQPGSIKVSADIVVRNFKDADTVLDDSTFTGLRIGLGKELSNGFAIETGVTYYGIDLEDSVGTDLGGLDTYVMDLGLSKTFYIWRFSIKAEGGGTLTYMDLDIDSGSLALEDDELLFGAYGSLGLGFNITKNLMVSAEARYDYTEDFGDTDFSISGESIAIGLEYRF